MNDVEEPINENGTWCDICNQYSGLCDECECSECE